MQLVVAGTTGDEVVAAVAVPDVVATQRRDPVGIAANASSAGSAAMSLGSASHRSPAAEANLRTSGASCAIFSRTPSPCGC